MGGRRSQAARRRWASGALAAGILIAGAAMVRGDGGSTTSGAIPERLVSSCPGARDAMGYGPDLLTHVESWWRVESIDDPFEVDASVRRTEHLAMTLRAVGPSGEGEAERRTIAVHSTFLDGLRWGLGSEEVDVAYLSIQSEELDEPMTSAVLLVTDDGTARFVGDCANRMLNDPLAGVLGAQLDRQVARIPRLAPGDVAEIIRSDEHPPSP